MTNGGSEQHARPRAGVPRSKLPLCLAICAALAAVAGCRRDEVTHVRVAKQPAEPSSPGGGMGGMGMPGGGAMPASADVAPPPTPSGAGALRWSLPKGWTEEKGAGGMRYATLKAPVSGKLDVSVVVLPGPAGGELANVNRWRNQIGLPPLEEDGLGASRKVVKSKAGPISLYDFESEGTKKTRVVAGYTFADGNTWFVKMTGDADAVQTARPAFLALVESLRFDASTP
jgi:hypothetical protein